MNRRACSGLFASILVFSLVPWSAANNLDGMAEPWPALLSYEPANCDPEIAALQHRAQVSLASLVEAGRRLE